jgi:hypothetical protein
MIHEATIWQYLSVLLLEVVAYSLKQVQKLPCEARK